MLSGTQAGHDVICVRGAVPNYLFHFLKNKFLIETFMLEKHLNPSLRLMKFCSMVSSPYHGQSPKSSFKRKCSTRPESSQATEGLDGSNLGALRIQIMTGMQLRSLGWNVRSVSRWQLGWLSSRSYGTREQASVAPRLCLNTLIFSRLQAALCYFLWQFLLLLNTHGCIVLYSDNK